MFRFADPGILNLLILVPLAMAGWWYSAWRQHARLQQFAHPRQIPWLTHLNSPRKRWLSKAALILALTCLILAAARPQWGMMRSQADTEGLDIVFVVDSSRSMLATDIVPNRMERVKRALFHLVDRLSRHRIGLLTFAGVSFMNCPLTQDGGALKLLIDSLDPANLPISGTDIGTALEQGLDAFQRTGARHQAMIIVSDGENFGKKPFKAIKQANKQGVKIYCLGVGTDAGAKVPEREMNPGIAQVKNTGHITKLHEQELILIAQLGEGKYARLSPAGQEEEDLVEELNKLEKAELISEKQYDWVDFYPWGAMLGAMLLLFEFLMSTRRSRPWSQVWQQLRGSMKKIIPLTGGLLVLAWMTPAAAAGPREWTQQGIDAFTKKDYKAAERWFNLARQQNAGDALAEYNYGCAILRQMRFDDAYKAFCRAQPHARHKLMLDTWYNLGYAAFYSGMTDGNAEKWTEAAEAFKQCLLLDPTDDDARYNLEIILREIKKNSRQLTRREEQNQGKDQGQNPGSGADKPGTDRQNDQGKAKQDAPPQEAQETTKSRQTQSGNNTTSEDMQGNKQQGMSQEDALRTLRSLEAEENTVKKNFPQTKPREQNYNGPDW